MAKRTPSEPAKSGTVALVGRTNVGKSTLLNAALEMPLAIVSRKPQTTRDRLLGVVRHRGAEIGLLDTPGLHRAQTKLGRAMNKSAHTAARDADVVVLVTAIPPQAKGALRPHPQDLELLGKLPPDKALVIVVNKIDKLRDKSQLLPLLEALAAAHPKAAIVPISALRKDGILLVLDEVTRLLPEGAALHDEETVTDRPVRWFVREYVREPILELLEQEVPHAVAVTIDTFEEPKEGVARIAATIHVERPGQKQILIGKGGEMLKRVGIRARQRIEELMGRRIHLELWVRVTPGWRDRPELLADFGLLDHGKP